MFASEKVKFYKKLDYIQSDISGPKKKVTRTCNPAFGRLRQENSTNVTPV